MKTYLVGVLTALTAFAPVLSVAADAATTPSVSAPLKIDRCAIVPPTGPNKSGTGRAWLNVQFRNLQSGAVDAVTFRVDDLGSDGTIVDKGTFAQGVLIDHSFATRLRSDVRQERPAHCAIVSLHFSNGTTWQPSS